MAADRQRAEGRDAHSRLVASGGHTHSLVAAGRYGDAPLLGPQHLRDANALAPDAGAAEMSEREALEHVEALAISVTGGQWAVESPMWWTGFDGPDLDAALAAGLIRIVPSKRSYQLVRITAAGKRRLAEGEAKAAQVDDASLG